MPSRRRAAAVQRRTAHDVANQFSQLLLRFVPASAQSRLAPHRGAASPGSARSPSCTPRGSPSAISSHLNQAGKGPTPASLLKPVLWFLTGRSDSPCAVGTDHSWVVNTAIRDRRPVPPGIRQEAPRNRPCSSAGQRTPGPPGPARRCGQNRKPKKANRCRSSHRHPPRGLLDTGACHEDRPQHKRGKHEHVDQPEKTPPHQTPLIAGLLPSPPCGSAIAS